MTSDGPLRGILFLAIVTLAACSTQRPVTQIHESADRAYGLGDHAAAAAEYELIVDRYPGDWRAHHRLGECYLELDRPTDARRELEIAMTRRPDDAAIADDLAEAHYQLGDENTLFVFLRERAERTHSVHAWLRVARYAVLLGDADAAKVALDTAIEFDDGRTVEPYLDAASFADAVKEAAAAE